MNLDQIKKDIAEFERFKADMERQQVTFPLDTASQIVIHKDLPIPTGQIVYPGDVTSYGAEAIEAIVNGTRYLIKAKV